MRAIQVHSPGGPEKLQMVDIAAPTPGTGQILVKIAYSGVNYIDTYYRTGLYKSELPIDIGMEAAGVVEAVGPDVRGFAAGQRVAYCMARGSYAEYAVVPAWQAVQIPGSVGFDIAAAALLQGMTAHYLTHSTFSLKAGDTALVHAAAGGTGLLVVQMARMLGARVIGTVSTEAKAAIAREAGANEVILYNSQDFAAEAKRLTDGRGVDVVYDSVGAATFLKSLDSLRPRGMLVAFGNASGPVPAVEPLLLGQKGSLYLTRPNLFQYAATPEELQWRAGEVLNWIAAGRLKINIHRTYSLAEASQAHVDLESRATSGKLLIKL
jgi:NADPH2:quinone reductase